MPPKLNPPDRREGAGRAAAPVLVADLERGQQVDRVFLVENSNFKQTRNNKFFIQADIRDRSGSIKAIRWEATRDLFLSFGSSDFVHVIGRVEEFQQHLQIIIDEIWKVAEDEIDIDLFLPTTEYDIGAMERELEARVDAIADADLKRLLKAFLAQDEVRAGLKRCPAGKTLHHAWVGGLLEHIVSLCRGVDLICKNYPRLDRDLLMAGAILHDIGKLRELRFDRIFRYTDVGQLVGHIAIGISWCAEVAARLAGFPQNRLVELQHLIASHHGEPEFGAVKAPMTQEAIALHYLDNLDAKLAIFAVVQKEQKLGSNGAAIKADGAPDDPKGGPRTEGRAEGRGDGRVENWSDFHPAMGRRLYFP
jgi:3'-5' exoribonuclease